VKNIEFVSYDGAYPNLCSGKLTVKIDGKEVSFGYATKSWSWEKEEDLAEYPRFWCSGGSVSFDEDWNEEVISYCDWEMSSPNEKDYPPEIWKLLPDILEVMNENVAGGCCGGCV
jgi:hypothetical protein